MNSAVVSADGTRIGYRELGAGPGLILVHGSMMSAHNLMALAADLSRDFTVYVPDRRGRGSSGAFGETYGIQRECEDLGALVEATGARFAFGLSSGAIICLQASLTLPLEKVALYEPPLLFPGSAHTGWVARYERELAEQRLAAAMVTILKGTADASLFARVPRFLLVPFFRLALQAEAKDLTVGHVPLRDLIPTMSFDARLVAETKDRLEAFATSPAKILLLGGAKSAPYLRAALDALGRALPNAERVELAGVGHIAADNGGDPARVAAALREFF